MERVVLHNQHVVDAFWFENKFWERELLRISLFALTSEIELCEKRKSTSLLNWVFELSGVCYEKSN